eukprot:6190522-Pleurochrysis_carterae.AAC.2
MLAPRRERHTRETGPAHARAHLVSILRAAAVISTTIKRDVKCMHVCSCCAHPCEKDVSKGGVLVRDLVVVLEAEWDAHHRAEVLTICQFCIHLERGGARRLGKRLHKIGQIILVLEHTVNKRADEELARDSAITNKRCHLVYRHPDKVRRLGIRHVGRQVKRHVFRHVGAVGQLDHLAHERRVVVAVEEGARRRIVERVQFRLDLRGHHLSWRMNVAKVTTCLGKHCSCTVVASQRSWR